MAADVTTVIPEGYTLVFLAYLNHVYTNVRLFLFDNKAPRTTIWSSTYNSVSNRDEMGLPSRLLFDLGALFVNRRVFRLV